MKSRGIPELPLINCNQTRHSSQNNNNQYPQSTKNSYQTANWNSKALNIDNINDGSISYRIDAPHSYQDVDKHQSRKNSYGRLSGLNQSVDIINNARSSSMVMDRQQQQMQQPNLLNANSNKNNYYSNEDQQQYQIEGYQSFRQSNGMRNNDYQNSYTFRQNINPQSNEYDKQTDIQQLNGETRTHFYTNRDKKNKNASNIHQQGFYNSPNNLDEEDRQYELEQQNQNKFNYQTQLQLQQQQQSNNNFQESNTNCSTDSKNNSSNFFMPQIDSSQNDKKTFMPKTSENYKFFLNSALRDIHGIYQENKQLNNMNRDKKRYGSTLKSSQTSQEFIQEPQRRLSSQTGAMRYGSQDLSLAHTQQDPVKQQINKEHGQRKREFLSPRGVVGAPYLTNQILVNNMQQTGNKSPKQNDKILDSYIVKNIEINQKNNRQQYNRVSLDTNQAIQQQNDKSYFLNDKITLKEVNKNHLRRNFNQRRIQELSKPKYANQKQSYPQEKEKGLITVQIKRKQSPIKISSQKTNRENLEDINHKNKQESIEDKTLKNSSILKSDNKERTTQQSTKNNLETQQIIESQIFPLDTINDDHDNMIDQSFEKLQKLVKQQNHIQDKVQSHATVRISSIDKIKILIGKGKFHFSKKINFVGKEDKIIKQQKNEDDNLNMTKEFIKRQQIAQIKNEKIERILSLKDNEQKRFGEYLESSFTNKSFQGDQSQISLFSQNNNNVASSSQYFSSRLSNFQKLKGINKYKSEQLIGKKTIEWKVNYGFKLDKEIEFFRKQKEQKETKEREEAQQKIKSLKEQNCKQIYQREKYRDLEVDIIIHQEEIQTKIVFGDKVSFIKIPVISNSEELDIQYINKIDEQNTLCASQKYMKGLKFILRKQKMTDLKGFHYLFHVNSLMAKENDLYLKDPVAVRVDSEYYLLQFFKVYRTLQDLLLTWNSSSIQSKPSFAEEQYYSTSQTNSDCVTNQENYEDEQKDSCVFDDSQVIFIYQQILQNVCLMNSILNIYHANISLENIAIFEGNRVAIISYDDTSIIYRKSNSKNYIISDNNLNRVQFQKYVKYQDILSKELSPYEYQLHDIICLFIQIKFANPDLMSENQFKQAIKILNLEQPLSQSGKVIKQLIQYQQMGQYNMLDSYSQTLFSDKPIYPINILHFNKFQNRFDGIDQIIFYLTTIQLQKANQVINTLSQDYALDILIFRALYFYLQKNYEKSYEQITQLESLQQSNINNNNNNNLNKNQENQELKSLLTNQFTKQLSISSKFYFWKGRIEFMCKQFDKQNESFEKYIKESQNECDALLDLADFYKHIVNLNKSISYYEQAEKYVVNNRESNLHQTYYVQIMKRQIYFHQNTENKDKQIECINRCIQFLTQIYKDDTDCELSTFKQQFSHLLQPSTSNKF